MTQEMPIIPDRMCPEAVAYDLMRDIMFDDPKRPMPTSAEFRGYVLDLYNECLATVRGERLPPRPAPAASVIDTVRVGMVAAKSGGEHMERAGSKRRVQPAQA